MAKFKCKVCGYIHEGNKAPDLCPVCQAPASEFEEIKEEGAGQKKGLNRDSNIYTVLYAAVMVLVVAVVLAFTSQSLKSAQKANEDNDKRHPEAVPQHYAENSQDYRARPQKAWKRLGHKLTESVDIVGVNGHDISVCMSVKIFNRKILHMCKKVIAHLLDTSL